VRFDIYGQVTRFQQSSSKNRAVKLVQSSESAHEALKSSDSKFVVCWVHCDQGLDQRNITISMRAAVIVYKFIVNG